MVVGKCAPLMLQQCVSTKAGLHSKDRGVGMHSYLPLHAATSSDSPKSTQHFLLPRKDLCSLGPLRVGVLRGILNAEPPQLGISPVMMVHYRGSKIGRPYQFGAHSPSCSQSTETTSPFRRPIHSNVVYLRVPRRVKLNTNLLRSAVVSLSKSPSLSRESAIST